MASQFKRLADDVVKTWSAMPKSQALRWYSALLFNLPTVLRERKLYSADHAMKGDLRFFALGRDFTIDVDAINSSAGNGYAFLREFFVRQVYLRGFNPIRFTTTLDLGSNTGVCASILRELAGPDGRVVGIDPLVYPDSAFNNQVRTIPGLTIHQGFLCGESMRHDPAALHAMCDPYGFNVDQTITVQELMEIYGVKHVDFVKMDIEGAEFNIFNDSIEWLSRVDNLAMEVHNYVDDPTKIIDRLKGAGFEVKWLDDAGYPTAPRSAGYIYASRVGGLKD